MEKRKDEREEKEVINLQSTLTQELNFFVRDK
jgi:hypothetical protein